VGTEDREVSALIWFPVEEERSAVEGLLMDDVRATKGCAELQSELSKKNDTEVERLVSQVPFL